MLFTGLGRSVVGLSTALCLRPRAVFKTSGRVSHNTDLPAGELHKPIMCEFEINFKKYIYIFCWGSHRSNDDLISVFVNMYVAFCGCLQV